MSKGVGQFGVGWGSSVCDDFYLALSVFLVTMIAFCIWVPSVLLFSHPYMQSKGIGAGKCLPAGNRV